MGIQIVSVLAKSYHQQLITLSGVKLVCVDKWGRNKSLPDPQEDSSEYVKEVIHQWSIGQSYRPPTWRQLLEILQDMGLVGLSQKIEAFMKGKTIW